MGLRLWLLPTAAAAAAVTTLELEGRWAEVEKEGYIYSDWPCSSLALGVDGSGTLEMEWGIERVRVEVTVEGANGTLDRRVIKGNAFELPFERYPKWEKVSIPLPPGSSRVTLRKMTTASPFATGIATDILRWSKWFVRTPTGANRVRRGGKWFEFIGASDTAGYCVDGNPQMGKIVTGLEGWEYENCVLAYPGQLGTRFNATVSVQASSGLGLLQNGNAKEKWQLGKRTAPDYFPLTLQSEALEWNFTDDTPDAVFISLGGNDYNHQDGNVPSNATFTKGYADFLRSGVFGRYGAETRVIAVCGMGDPTEAKRDPDNNRCRPCPHVEEAVAEYNKEAAVKVTYLFIPCDGSVVTGDGDIGCAGHKNHVGQQRVADFIATKLGDIL